MVAYDAKGVANAVDGTKGQRGQEQPAEGLQESRAFIEAFELHRGQAARLATRKSTGEGSNSYNRIRPAEARGRIHSSRRGRKSEWERLLLLRSRSRRPSGRGTRYTVLHDMGAGAAVSPLGPGRGTSWDGRIMRSPRRTRVAEA
jgi:hypothetical protein